MSLRYIRDSAGRLRSSGCLAAVFVRDGGRPLGPHLPDSDHCGAAGCRRRSPAGSRTGTLRFVGKTPFFVANRGCLSGARDGSRPLWPCLPDFGHCPAARPGMCPTRGVTCRNHYAYGVLVGSCCLPLASQNPRPHCLRSWPHEGSRRVTGQSGQKPALTFDHCLEARQSRLLCSSRGSGQ